ncbi:MAG: 16S rRNA (guanine(527)-N(7))-methyltransferase RsmG [Chloroflexota bacterium]
MDRLISGALRLGISLTPGQVEQFERYYRELVEWNKRLNLTRIVDYEEVQTKHFLDSLTPVKALGGGALRGGWRLIDVGTGAGLPGIPLKILFPEMAVVLLDSAAKKAKFLHYIIHALGLENVEVVAGRAEEVARQEKYREKFPVVVSRAVAPLAVLAELTLPFCAVGGRFVAQKKGEVSEELDAAQQGIGLLGGRLSEVQEVDLPELGEKRLLIIIEKTSSTPEKYPRRPGMPAKRPVGT